MASGSAVCIGSRLVRVLTVSCELLALQSVSRCQYSALRQESVRRGCYEGEHFATHSEGSVLNPTFSPFRFYSDLQGPECVDFRAHNFQSLLSSDLMHACLSKVKASQGMVRGEDDNARGNHVFHHLPFVGVAPRCSFNYLLYCLLFLQLAHCTLDIDRQYALGYWEESFGSSNAWSARSVQCRRGWTRDQEWKSRSFLPRRFVGCYLHVSPSSPRGIETTGNGSEVCIN